MSSSWNINTLTNPGTAGRPTEQPSDVYQRLIAADKVSAPATHQSYPQDLGLSGTAVSRYTDPAFQRLEIDNMWTRVWQVACREEEIPQVGDVIVYDLAEHSYLVTRVAKDQVRAYRNACLHRGTRLLSDDTSVNQFRCPFHGWTWGLSGRLEEVPCRWDFPQVNDASHNLPEARVGIWGGFVFISMDPHGQSFEDYLGTLPEHVSGEVFANKYIANYFRKVLPANWKACLEAFLEAYHSVETHAWSLGFTNDANAQYDIFVDSPHISRFMHAFCVQSPHIDKKLDEQEILDEYFKIFFSSEAAPTLPAGKSARAFAADLVRERTELATGCDYSMLSDSEVLDSIEYTIFPNLVLFKGLSVPTVYRFRPNGNDPDTCIFDLYVLLPVPEGVKRPAPAEMFEMGDMAYSELPGFNTFFGVTYDQDTGNLGRQQRGMKTLLREEVTLGHYQESRLRHFQNTIDHYLAMGKAAL